MATYEEIQDYVLQTYHFKPKTCWIAHAKELYGLPLGTAPNRIGNARTNPCPQDKQVQIFAAFQHFNMRPAR